MNLQDTVPRLGEVAATICPATRPFAKLVGWGLSLTIWAGTSIYKELPKKNHQAKKYSGF